MKPGFARGAQGAIGGWIDWCGGVILIGGGSDVMARFERDCSRFAGIGHAKESAEAALQSAQRRPKVSRLWLNPRDPSTSSKGTWTLQTHPKHLRNEGTWILREMICQSFGLQEVFQQTVHAARVVTEFVSVRAGLYTSVGKVRWYRIPFLR